MSAYIWIRMSDVLGLIYHQFDYVPHRAMKSSSLPAFVVDYRRVLNRKAIRWRCPSILARSGPISKALIRKCCHAFSALRDNLLISNNFRFHNRVVEPVRRKRWRRGCVALLLMTLLAVLPIVFIFSASSLFVFKNSADVGFIQRTFWGSWTSPTLLLTSSGRASRHHRQLASAQGMGGGHQEDLPTVSTSTSTSSSTVESSSQHVNHVDDYEYDSSLISQGPSGRRIRRRTYYYPKCGCYRDINVEDGKLDTDALSTCDGFATLRGRHQKVVSFSFYGNSSASPYFGGIKANAEKLGELYPGWTMRVYHNVDLEDVIDNSNESMNGVDGVMLNIADGSTSGRDDEGKEDDELRRSSFCDIVCQYDNVDMCDVRSLHSLGDVSDSFGMLWRFLVLGDPTVETFVVRDLDSVISRREAEAVQDWIHSGRRFHVMRDSPMHNALFLGGLWGAHNYHPKNRLIAHSSPTDAMSNTDLDYSYSNDVHSLNQQERINDDVTNAYEAQAREWRDRMLLAADGLSYKGLDQHVLNGILGPAVVTISNNIISTAGTGDGKFGNIDSSLSRNADTIGARESSSVAWNDLISHDSYTCRNFPDSSKPWPSRRKGREFVGSPRLLYPEASRVVQPCPMECRPDGHKDWLFC